MTNETLIRLLSLVGFIATLVFLRRHDFRLRWKRILVATKVEFAIAKNSGVRFLREFAILVAIAFFAAEILTNTRFVRDDAFIWLLTGLPICFFLARFWWREYR